MNPGTHNAKLQLPRIADQLFTTSQSGKDGVVLHFKTEDGGEIHTTLWLSPNAYDRSLQVLKEVFGFNGDWNSLAKTLTLPNLECRIVVEMEDYEAKDGSTKQTPRVKWINPRGAAQKEAAGGVEGVLQRLAKLSGSSNVNAEFQRAKQVRNQTADDSDEIKW